MNTNVSIHLSEHAFELLSERASSVGKTPAELAASVVENACSQECSPFLDGAIARAEFERLIVKFTRMPELPWRSGRLRHDGEIVDLDAPHAAADPG